jgi:hypothetical protein
VDLTACSFDEFVAFFIQHEVAAERRQPGGQKEDQWYWHIDDEYILEKSCGYYIRLFRSPEFLLERY